MKWRSVLAALLGAALIAWLLLRTGLGAVLASIATLGAGGFALICGFQLVMAALAGAAWAALGRGGLGGGGQGRDGSGAGPGRFVWARLVRDAAGAALPFAQVGGIALGGRALALEGVPGVFATASTLTDMAVEFTTQFAYAALGAALLQVLHPHNPLGRPVLGLIAVLALMTGGLVWSQGRGAHLVEGLARRATRRAGEAAGNGVAGTLAAIRRRPAALAAASAGHLAAWGLSSVQTWLTLRLLHAPTSLAAALVLDSLTTAAKAAAFLVPGALGVQEGALVLLGHLFGIAAPAALALSLVRRGRDLVLALPVLGVWQLRHGERIWTLAPGGPDAAQR